METLPLPCHPACPSLPRNRSEAKRRDLRYYRTHRGKEAKPTCPDISPARKGWEIGGYGPGTWLTLQLSPSLSCVRTVSICSQQPPCECWNLAHLAIFGAKLET